MTHDDILNQLKAILQDNFEIDPARITPEANLYEDLDLDSIDAVDLVIQVQDLLGAKVSPEQFKTARTVEDVIQIVLQLHTERAD